jgi:type I restriction enzyme S subunit
MISQGQIGSFAIALPTLPEQQKIAAFLGAVDRKIQQLKRKQALLEQYKKGVVQQLFTQELRFKREDGGEFPEWEEKRLGDVADVIMGQSPDSSSYNASGEGLPLIQGNADIVGRVTSPRQWTSEPTKTCLFGDIILSVRAPVGAVARSVHAACIGRGVCAIRPKPSGNVEYLYHLMIDFEPKWKGIEQGSTFTAISGEDVRDLEFPFPSLEEQSRIAGFLMALDAKVAGVAQAVAAAQKWKKGLLQQMFV